MTSVSPEQSYQDHLYADKDQGAEALHHTLGKSANQAAQGDHTHKYSEISGTPAAFSPIWQDYTPTATNITAIGTGGVIAGRYIVIGKLIIVRFRILGGSTGYSGAAAPLQLSLPVVPDTTNGAVGNFTYKTSHASTLPSVSGLARLAPGASIVDFFYGTNLANAFNGNSLGNNYEFHAEIAYEAS